MKRLFLQIFLLYIFYEVGANAAQYPNLSGSALFQLNTDRVLSSQKSGVPATNAFGYVESDFGLNFDNNWAVKTQWRLQPNDVLTTRDKVNPERYRTFLSADRGLQKDGYGLLVEELKLQFKNEDMLFYAGKFDPKFGVAHDKKKRMGVFTSQFTEDYNLREKIGASISAMLEKSKITLNSFFNDTTALSNSALSNRGKASGSGTSGSTKSLNSYSVSVEGKDLFEIEDWTYNIGFKSLSIDRALSGRQREKGYVFGSEYLYKVGDTSFVPFVEIVKVTSVNGERGRNSTYSTAALIAKYSSWVGSVSYLTRDIKSHKANEGNKKSDQLQISAGYKFTDNITIDVTRSSMKEDGNKGSMVGVLLSYFYRF